MNQVKDARKSSHCGKHFNSSNRSVAKLVHENGGKAREIMAILKGIESFDVGRMNCDGEMRNIPSMNSLEAPSKLAVWDVRKVAMKDGASNSHFKFKNNQRNFAYNHLL